MSFRPTTPNNLFLIMAYYKLVFYVQGAWHSQTTKHSLTPVVGRLVFSIRSTQSSDASFVGVVLHSRETKRSNLNPYVTSGDGGAMDKKKFQTKKQYPNYYKE